jgi:hypothetical protein
MARPLSFRATRVEHDPTGPTLAFTVEADGDPNVFFSMTMEEPEEKSVRVHWGDGEDGRDECVLQLMKASLSFDKFEAELTELDPDTFPYSGVALSFEKLDEMEASGAAGVLAQLAQLGDALKLAPGISATAPTRASILPRRVGAPMLGVAAKGQWSASARSDLDLVLLLSNLGGALESGVLIEVAGAALDAKLVAPRTIRGTGGQASFEQAGSVARASLPELKLAADFDVDRRADKKAARPPTTELKLSIQAQKAGSGLLTVRVIPGGRPDRSGSAMVGRTIVIA